MSIDMSQFYQVFFEETAEHLGNMENLLLALDIDNPDSEQLNAIFRAAHSIKGSSGTFGFTDLQDVTHILENLLDRVRKGELHLRDEMIDAFLDAGDVLKNLLAAHQGDGEADREAADAICQRLRQLTEDTAAPAPDPAPVAAVSPAPTIAQAAESQTGFDLHFVLEGDAVTAEATLENLMLELAEQGDVHIVGRASGEGQPWHLRMLGVTDGEALRGMLDFVARSDTIRIAPLGQVVVAPQDIADDSYGFFEPQEGISPDAPAAARHSRSVARSTYAADSR